MSTCRTRGRGAHRRAAALPAVLVVAALLLACLTPEFGARVVDPSDGDRHGAELTLVLGDDLGLAVLPTIVGLVVLATAAVVVLRSAPSPRLSLVAVHRGRAPPRGIDC